MRIPVAVAAAVVLLPLLPGCDVDRGTGNTNVEPVMNATITPARETYALGTTVTPAGAVPAEAVTEQFMLGGEIFLSVDVHGASTDQRVGVKWVAPNGAVIREEERLVPQRADYVWFSTGATHQWPRGEHRAVVVIDGRRVTERPFSMI